jgi:hypothetical protein
LFSTSLANGLVTSSEAVSIGQRLDVARRALSLFQHHDGITGTAKDFVVADYSSKLLRGLVGCEEVMSELTSNLVSERQVPLRLAESMPRWNSALKVGYSIQSQTTDVNSGQGSLCCFASTNS